LGPENGVKPLNTGGAICSMANTTDIQNKPIIVVGSAKGCVKLYEMAPGWNRRGLWFPHSISKQSETEVWCSASSAKNHAFFTGGTDGSANCYMFQQAQQQQNTTFGGSPQQQQQQQQQLQLQQQQLQQQQMQQQQMQQQQMQQQQIGSPNQQIGSPNQFNMGGVSNNLGNQQFNAGGGFNSNTKTNTNAGGSGAFTMGGGGGGGVGFSMGGVGQLATNPAAPVAPKGWGSPNNVGGAVGQGGGGGNMFAQGTQMNWGSSGGGF
jgi:hypothetical protein